MKKILIICMFMLVGTSVSAQRVPSEQEIFVSGYEQKIAGNEIKYGSGVSGVDNALITRAGNGKQVMVWKTAIVDIADNASFVTLINYVGYDSRKIGTPFNFYVNGSKKGVIKIPEKKLNEWNVKFEDGSELNFKRHFVD